MDQQADRGDRLHRLAEAHLVGEDGGVPWHEKRYPLELERERLAGEIEMAGAEERFQVGLEEEPEPLFHPHDIPRWGDPRPSRPSHFLCG